MMPRAPNSNGGGEAPAHNQATQEETINEAPQVRFKKFHKRKI